MIYFITKQKFKNTSDITTKNKIEPVLNYLENLEQIDNKIYTLDTETTGLDPHSNNLLLIQIGDDQDQFVIDFRHPEIYQLYPYLEDDSYVKILANAKFDYKQIWKHCGVHIDNVYDVLLVDRLVYNGLLTDVDERMFRQENGYGRFSLEGLTIKYLKRTLEKSVRNTFINHEGDFTESQILYAASDIDIPYLLKPILDKSLKKYNLETVAKLENQVTVAFAEMEFNGIKIDLIKWDDIYNSNISILFKTEEELDTIVENDKELRLKYTVGKQLGMFAGTDKRSVIINWRSPKQKIELLNRLNFNLYIKDKVTGLMKESVDVSMLKQQEKKHPIAPLLIKYAETSKSVSSYGSKFLRFVNSRTRRAHTEIFQIKDTGRTGSGKPNLQNIPATSKYRHCFVPEGKMKFIVTDYSNMELRVIADKSGEEALITAFKEGKDVHSQMAIMIQKVVYNRKINISKDENKNLRDESKTITFLVAYGGSAFKLKDNLNIEIEEAQKLIDSYFKAFPKLKKFANSLKSFGINKGYIRTFKPFNRIRWFPKHKEYKRLYNEYNKSEDQIRQMMKIKGAIERASSNTPIQGSSADIMKTACYGVHKYLINLNKKLGIDNPNESNRNKLLLQVHDELIVEAQSSLCEEIAREKKIIMEDAAKDIMSKVQMIAEPVITDKWEH